MFFESNKILEFNQYQKSEKALFIIYADLECLMERIYVCKNNPENSSTTKAQHVTTSFSMSTIFWFKNIGNKHGV